jgi:hypothetical protein
MRRLAQQSFGRVLVLAIAWPLFLCAVGIVLVFVLGRSGMLISVSVSGPVMLLLLFGPPLLLILAWALARRDGGTAT